MRAWGDNRYLELLVPPGLSEAVAVAAGFDHSLALRRDGTVVGWGRNSEGQASVPVGLTNVIAIAGGGYHSVALRADGSVIAWGYNGDGQSRVPAGLADVVGIAAGGFHTVVLKGDGTVVAWGSNLYQQTNVPPDLSNIVAIAAGGHHNLALRADGTVIGWGRNESGQTDTPPGLRRVVAVVAGHQHSVALKDDGTVLAWGLNQAGQTNVPPDLTNAVAIAGIGYHALALAADGRLVAWGENGFGESSIPPDLTNVAAVAGGWGHTLAIPGPQEPSILAHPAHRSVYARTNVTFRVAAAGSPPMHYQWEWNGLSLEGATNVSLALHQVQETNSGTYRVVVTNAYGMATSSKATLTVLMPLADALDTLDLDWTTPMPAPWLGQTEVTQDGTDALRSGAVADGQQSTLQTSVIGPGTLSFWWKVSSETNVDTLRFVIGLVTQLNISGEVDWRQEVIYMGPGSRPLRWRYVKSSSGAGGQDAGWLDQVSYLPGGTAPEIVDQPLDQQIQAGNSATLGVRAVGTPPLSYQWQKDGFDLAGATNTTLTLTNLHRSDSGWVAVTVTNLHGQAVSSNASLRVRAPQQFVQPAWTGDGSFDVLFGDADGSELRAADVAGFEVQASTNLLDWVTLTDPLILTNGLLLWHDPGSASFSARFYRVRER